MGLQAWGGKRGVVEMTGTKAFAGEGQERLCRCDARGALWVTGRKAAVGGYWRR